MQCDTLGLLGKPVVKVISKDLRRSAVPNMVRAGVPEMVCTKVSGYKTRNAFDRYNTTSERDQPDAARKIEISQRHAKVAGTQQETQNTEPVTIQ